MKNKEAMRIVLEQLKDVLITDKGKICALGEAITKINYYSAHHIKAVRNYGKTTPSNIIPLSFTSHNQFNFIERCSEKMAKDINDGFIELKQTKNGLIIAQLKIVKDDLLKKYGYENRKAKTKRR
jgi:hypothetical protein